MASDGPRFPASQTQYDFAGGPAWSNPGNVLASDNSRASVSLGGSSPDDDSDWLEVTSFSFAVPAGSTVDGVLVEVEGLTSGAGAGNSGWRVELKKGASTFSAEKARFLGPDAAEAFYSFPSSGAETDLWGLTLGPSDVNDSAFGCRFRCSALGGDAQDVSIDSIRLTVFFTVPANYAMLMHGAG